MARERRSGNIWPAWFYNPSGEGMICKDISEVPDGWQRKKQTVYVPPAPTSYDKEALLAQLQDKGILVNPTWGVAHMNKVLND